MKVRGFTLVEILIAISIFSIITLFLYKALDQTKNTNDFFASKLVKQERLNDLKKVIFLDLMEKVDGNITIKANDELGSIVQFQSANSFHNPFYSHITYLVSKDKNLIRLESQTKFLLDRTPYEFYDTTYIDRLANDIEKFEVIQNGKKLVVYIKQKNSPAIAFQY